MLYWKRISREQQKEWFAGLHQKNDWYFISYHQEVPFALLHVKSINWTVKLGEAGAFVGNPQYLGNPLAGYAILAMMDFAFFGLDLDYLEAKYDSTNKAISALNNQLGYEVTQSLENGFVKAQVSKVNYQRKAAPLIRATKKSMGDRSELYDPDDWLVEHITKFGDPEKICLELGHSVD
jgi:RimJ/RimL family protein N-acetyltransferase